MAVSIVAYFMGPAFILCCITLILFGVVCAQAYRYWTTYNRDPACLKLCVLLVCMLETLHTIFVLHELYSYLITPDVPVLFLNTMVWSVPALLLAAISMIAMIQGFYVYRIYQLSKHNLYATAAPLISLVARAGLAVVTAILIIQAGTWTEVHNSSRLHFLITFGSSLNVFTDTLITLLFSYYIYKCKTSIRRTQNILRRLTVYTINTGALAIFASSAVIIMYLLSPTVMFAGMYTLVGKIYAFSMFAQLNTRENLRKQGACSDDQAIHLSDMSSGTLMSSSGAQQGINVTETKYPAISDPLPLNRSDIGNNATPALADDQEIFNVV